MVVSGLVMLAWAGPARADAPAAAPAPESAPAAAPAPESASGSAPAVAPAPESAVAPAEPDKLAQNSVFAEGLGAAMLYSFNYERMVVDQLGVRVGFGYFSVGASANAGGNTATAGASYLFIPVTLSYVGLRSGRSALELGGGVTVLYVSDSASAAGVATSGAGMVPFGVAMVGYRNQPVGHAGFMFRIGFETLVASGIGLQNPTPGTLGFIPWPYLSLGASF